MPPAWHRSGCRMLAAPFSRISRKPHFVKMRSPVGDQQARARILQGTPVDVVEEPRRLDDLARQLNHIGTLDAVHECCTRGDAASQADDGDAPRLGMQQQRQVAQKLLGEHVGAVRRVDLAVDRQRTRAGQPAHRAVGTAARER